MADRFSWTSRIFFSLSFSKMKKFSTNNCTNNNVPTAWYRHPKKGKRLESFFGVRISKLYSSSKRIGVRSEAKGSIVIWLLICQIFVLIIASNYNRRTSKKTLFKRATATTMTDP